MNLTRTVMAWLPMPFMGVANGIIRQFFLLKYFNDFNARQVSTLSLIVFLAVYIAVVFKKLSITSSESAWLTGVCWAILTVLFELAIGRFLSHLTFTEMLAAYNLMSGNLWSLVPLALLALPFIFYRLLQSDRHKL